MITIFRLILIFSMIGLSRYALADGICGDPPLLENSSMKGEISGKAQLLSKFVGNAQLTGKIETSRTEVLTKYPDAERTRGNAYFEYQICVLIMADKSMTTTQKLDELRKTRREFQKPLSMLKQSELDQLASIRNLCENAEFRTAQTLLSNLDAKFPDEKQILKTKKTCTNLSENIMDFDVTLEVSPGVFVMNEDGQAFATLSLRVEGSYCGLLSNLYETKTASCGVFPGMRRFVLSSITAYDSNRNIITQGANCGGQFLLKPSVEKYGILLCMKKPNITCGIVPLDSDFYAFNKDHCVFKT